MIIDKNVAVQSRNKRAPEPMQIYSR